MGEFFKGFQFRPVAKRLDFTIASEQITPKTDLTSTAPIKGIGFEGTIVDYTPDPWTAQDITNMFPKHLETVSEKINHPLDMKGRNLKIVKKDDLLPQK